MISMVVNIYQHGIWIALYNGKSNKKEEKKMEKTKIGFRFFYHKGNGNGNIPEYAHPEYYFYSFEDTKWREGWHRADYDLLTVKTQTDKEKGHSIFKSYGIHAENVHIGEDSIKILNAIKKAMEKNYNNPNRAIAKAIKSLKAQRLDYDHESRQMIPWKYRKNANLWVNAFKQGLRLEKIQ